MATAADPNLPPLFCNIRYSLKQTIKEYVGIVLHLSFFSKFIGT